MKNKLLIVENDKNLSLLYKQELEDIGYIVDITDSYQKAFGLYKTNSYNLVILELMNSGTNDLLKQMRILSDNRRIPIIINTGYKFLKNISVHMDVNALIIKSSDLTELKESIINCLERNSIRQKRYHHDIPVFAV